jgi:hypothetical protein
MLIRTFALQAYRIDLRFSPINEKLLLAFFRNYPRTEDSRFGISSDYPFYALFVNTRRSEYGNSKFKRYWAHFFALKRQKTGLSACIFCRPAGVKRIPLQSLARPSGA